MKLKAKDYQWCYNKMKYWQKELGMMNMKFYLHFNKDLESRGVCSTQWEGRIAEITLCEGYEFQNKQDLEMTIFHEVCEAMLSPLSVELTVQGVSNEKAQYMSHEVIRRLENLMFK